MVHKAVEILERVVVKQNTKGYMYLKAAIEIAAENPEKLEHLNRAIYGPIAEIHKVTTNAVQQAISGTIAYTWENGELEVLQHYFGETVLNTFRKPTNYDFISRIMKKSSDPG